MNATLPQNTCHRLRLLDLALRLFSKNGQEIEI